MRLVVVDVPDRRDHGDLALAVQRREAVRGRVPAQPAVLGEGRSGGLGDRDVRTQLVVQRVARREEHRQAVDPSGEVDDDENVLRRGRRGLRDPVLERAGRKGRAAVDPEREPRRPRDEVTPREARPRRQRHACLDPGQPAPGLGHRTAPVLGGIAVAALVRSHSSSSVKPTLTRFADPERRRRGGGAPSRRRPARRSASAGPWRTRRATSVSASRSSGCPRSWIALWTSCVGSVEVPVGAVVPCTSAAMNQRARHVAVSSQRV